MLKQRMSREVAGCPHRVWLWPEFLRAGSQVANSPVQVKSRLVAAAAEEKAARSDGVELLGSFGRPRPGADQPGAETFATAKTILHRLQSRQAANRGQHRAVVSSGPGLRLPHFHNVD